MVLVRDVYRAIDEVAPFANALDFDNVGVLVGDDSREVTRALVALDITRETVLEAVSIGANLIVSHHPVIFDPLRTISPATVPGMLLEQGIAGICCHTNIDLSPILGTNRILADLLGLKDFREEGEQPGDVFFSGELEHPMEPQEFGLFVKETLHASGIRLHQGDRTVKKVSLCSGAGGEFAASAGRLGADAFLTGEVRQHEILNAVPTGITVVEAGHYETEKPFAAPLAAYLKKKLPQVCFLLSKAEKPPFVTL